MNKILLFGSMIILSSRMALCQAPFVFPQGDAAWTVDMQSGSSGGGSTQPQIQHAEVTQLNHLKRVHLVWDDGKTTEKWMIPGLPVVFVQDPQTGKVRPKQDGGPEQLLENFLNNYDEAAFSWVTPASLKEKDPIDYGGKQCFHYVGEVVIPNMTRNEPGDHSQHMREAWIDAKTLLPVALNNGQSTSTFKFQDKPPTGPLLPPPAFKKEIAYYKGVMGYP